MNNKNRALLMVPGRIRIRNLYFIFSIAFCSEIQSKMEEGYRKRRQTFTCRRFCRNDIINLFLNLYNNILYLDR